MRSEQSRGAEGRPHGGCSSSQGAEGQGLNSGWCCVEPRVGLDGPCGSPLNHDDSMLKTHRGLIKQTVNLHRREMQFFRNVDAYLWKPQQWLVIKRAQEECWVLVISLPFFSASWHAHYSASDTTPKKQKHNSTYYSSSSRTAQGHLRDAH